MEKPRAPSVTGRIRNPFVGMPPNQTGKNSLNTQNIPKPTLPTPTSQNKNQFKPLPQNISPPQIKSFNQTIDKKQIEVLQSFKDPKQQTLTNVTKFRNSFEGNGDERETSTQSKQQQSKDILELIKRRLDSLKVLQLKTAINEANFYEELYLLECKYNKMNKPLKDLRRKIIVGEHEPTDDECKLFPLGSSGDKLVSEELQKEREVSKELLAISISSHAGKKGDFVKGIPEFWLTVFKRVGLISQLIEVYDEPVLKYLYDVDVELYDKKPYNFSLKFYFWPNEFFSDLVLTKTYEFKIELDSSEPYIFEAPETECSKGCKINWKKGKNVTRKVGFLNGNDHDDLRDRQPSFFNFFDTTDIGNKHQNLTCDEEADLAIDYEIGYTFKEKVIPRAILYYMGEINEDNDQSDLDEYEEDIDEDDDGPFKSQAHAKVDLKNLNRN